MRKSANLPGQLTMRKNLDITERERMILSRKINRALKKCTKRCQIKTIIIQITTTRMIRPPAAVGQGISKET